jgi:hypothetical protein
LLRNPNTKVNTKTYGIEKLTAGFLKKINKPSWASFNTSTGALEGTPTYAHAGTTAPIIISVSDGQAIVSLPDFQIQIRSLNMSGLN